MPLPAYMTPSGKGVRLGKPRRIFGDITEPPVGQATGLFHTEGRNIVGPDGYRFIPRGVNVGATIANNNNGWPDIALDGAYIQGQVNAGCTAARIVVYVTTRQSWSIRGKDTGASGITTLDKLVDDMTKAYRAKGLVVIMEAHDLTQSGVYGTDGKLSADGLKWIGEVKDFWRRYAGRWKNDTYVWFNLANEPNLKAPEWRAFHDETLQIIRNEVGAKNVVVTDLIYYASDIGRYGSNAEAEAFPRGYDPTMVPALIEKYGDVVASQHNYGSHGIFVNETNIRNYFNLYRQANVPIMVGEVGFPNAGQPSNIGNWQWEHDAAIYTMKQALDFNVGVMWWASNFNDAYRLYDAALGGPVKNEFDPATVKNEAGTAFFDYLSKSKASDQKKS